MWMSERWLQTTKVVSQRANHVWISSWPSFPTSVSPHWICVIEKLHGISGVYSADYFSVSVFNWVEHRGVKGRSVEAMLMWHLMYTWVLVLQFLQPWCCGWADILLQLLICHERFYYHSCHLECLTQSDCSLLGQNISFPVIYSNCYNTKILSVFVFWKCSFHAFSNSFSLLSQVVKLLLKWNENSFFHFLPPLNHMNLYRKRESIIYGCCDLWFLLWIWPLIATASGIMSLSSLKKTLKLLCFRPQETRRKKK